jgi:hypothetical protein
MMDFRPNILTNLRIYPGIVEDPGRIETLNDILNDLDILGFGELVQNFGSSAFLILLAKSLRHWYDPSAS